MSQPAVQLGQHPPATHTVVHLSDTHFLGANRPLYGAVDTGANLQTALERLAGTGRDIDAIVVTGDLTDLGEPEAYTRLRGMLEPLADRLEAELVWVMGNHDERAPYAQFLFDVEPSLAPQDRVYEVGGLRIVSLDSTVPGYHHGDLDDAQLDWLRDVLAEPAPSGTLLALHHPPLPSPVELMAVLELNGQDRLAELLRGTEVRAILAGHLHHPSFGSFAGIPVSVASATCYTIDAGAEYGSLRGIDAAHSFNLVELRETGVVHTVVPADAAVQTSGFPREALEHLAGLTADERREAFSRKQSPHNEAEAASSDMGAPNERRS